MSKIVNYFKESYVELTKKVTWPTWDKLQSSAIVVMVASALIAVVIWAVDMVFQNLMSFIYSL